MKEFVNRFLKFVINLITFGKGKKVAQIASVGDFILFVLGLVYIFIVVIFIIINLPNNVTKADIILIILLFFLLGFIFGFILSMHPNYKKSFYNSIIVACFMFSLFLGLALSENLRSLKANLLNAGFILSILYVLALKKSKEPLPKPDSKLLELASKLLKPDSKLLELVSKLISCLKINVPISVIIIIGLFNYCLVYCFDHFIIGLFNYCLVYCFDHFITVIIIIIIVIIIIITLIYILKKSSLLNLNFSEAVAHIIYFVQLFIIFPIFLYGFIKLTKINGITVNKLIIQIIVDKLILLISLLFSFIFVSSVNYFIVYIVDKLKKFFKK